MKKQYKIAIIGATGNVGQALIRILSENSFLIKKIGVFASKNSLGKTITFLNQTLKIYDLDEINFQDFDIVFFCTSSEVVKQYAPKAIEQSCIVIDKSSLHRLDPKIPLVIPEINFELIPKDRSKGLIISNPNCCAIALALVLFPLHKRFGIRRIVISTYQSVSGAGFDAMDELFNQTRSKLSFTEYKQKIFPTQIAFNLIPFIGNLVADDVTEEEYKIEKELQKILSNEIKISVTAVRVPVFISHSASVNIELTNDFEKITEIEETLSSIKTLRIVSKEDDIEESTAVFATNKHEVFVSRIRKDHSQNRSINLWICADNLMKGSALNAFHILEKLSIANE